MVERALGILCAEACADRALKSCCTNPDVRRIANKFGVQLAAKSTSKSMCGPFITSPPFLNKNMIIHILSVIFWSEYVQEFCHVTKEYSVLKGLNGVKPFEALA